jgi:hypothetical protein
MYAWYGASIESATRLLPSVFPRTHSVNSHSAFDRDSVKESVCEFFSSTFAIRSSTPFRLKHVLPTAMFA